MGGLLPCMAHVASLMNLQRVGLKRCKGAKGPDGSHHWLASAANFSASLLSMLGATWVGTGVSKAGVQGCTRCDRARQGCWHSMAQGSIGSPSRPCTREVRPCFPWWSLA